MSCPICEHIQDERKKVARLLEETPKDNFRLRGGLLTARVDWDRAWDIHRATCQEAA